MRVRLPDPSPLCPPRPIHLASSPTRSGIIPVFAEMKHACPRQNGLWGTRPCFTPRNWPLKHTHPSQNALWRGSMCFISADSVRWRATWAIAGAREGREGLDKRASAFGSGDKAAVPGFGPLHNSCSSRDNSIPIRTAAPAPVDKGRHTFNQPLLPGSAQAPIPYLQAASLSERPVSQGARPGYAEPR